MKINVPFKKVLGIVFHSLLYALLIICAVVMLISITAKKSDDGSTQIFNYKLMSVLSESMEKNSDVDVSEYNIKSISKNSLIFVRVKPDEPEALEAWYSSLKVGDVLTFRYKYVQQVTLTHRISSISPKSTGGYIIELQGDNATDVGSQAIQVIDTSQDLTSANHIIGKVVGQSRVLGWILKTISHPIGLFFGVIIPCLIIILLEVFNILNLINSDKQKKHQEELEKKDAEIEELRQKLTVLENSTPDNQSNNSN